MKILSTTSLALALALSAAGGSMLVSQPAFAKAAAPSYKLSDPVRKAVVASQEALKKSDVATATAQVNEAKAAIKTEDDRYVVGSQLYDIGKVTKDNKLQAEAIDTMLQSGRVDAASQPNFYLALGQLSYFAQDYAKAETAFDQAIKLNPNNRDLYALAAETKYKMRKPTEAVDLIQRAADLPDAAGTPVPQDWLARGIAIGVESKLAEPVTKLTYAWLTKYPNPTHWRDSLTIYRDLHTLDPDYELDMMRLQRAAGALRGERDYVEYANATYLRYPNEAKSVIDMAVRSGTLNLAQSRNAKELADIAAGKIAADKASLNTKVTTAKGAVSTADAYASYGEYGPAIDLYRKALTMGGLDANLVNTRLAVALASSGKKDEAKQVFASITGPRAALAHYWSIFLDQPAAAAAAPAATN